jgi:U4/U6.U5 tri-snRNP-associated protein 2
VTDPSLNDILNVLNPRFKPSALPALTHLPAEPSYTLAGTPFVPGYIGINNVKKNDYLTVILHLLLHIPPIRTFLLDPRTPELQPTAKPTELVTRLADLTRRLWNPKLFKAQISPHEFLQEVNTRSIGKFKMTEQGDPVEFLGWLVNTLHRDLGGTKKRGSSVIYRALQGMVTIENQQVIIHKEYARPMFEATRGESFRYWISSWLC